MYHIFLSPPLVCVERAQSLLWWLVRLKVTLMMLTRKRIPVNPRTDQLKHLMPGTCWNLESYCLCYYKSLEEKDLWQCWRRLFPWKLKAFLSHEGFRLTNALENCIFTCSSLWQSRHQQHFCQEDFIKYTNASGWIFMWTLNEWM